jgi:hypothetical protein
MIILQKKKTALKLDEKKKTALKLDEKNKVQIWGFDFCCLSPKP